HSARGRVDLVILRVWTQRLLELTSQRISSVRQSEAGRDNYRVVKHRAERLAQERSVNRPVFRIELIDAVDAGEQLITHRRVIAYPRQRIGVQALLDRELPVGEVGRTARRRKVVKGVRENRDARIGHRRLIELDQIPELIEPILKLQRDTGPEIV